MEILQDLYVGILLTLIIVVSLRNFKVTIGFYMLHSFLIGLIYIWYARHMENPMMYVWFSSTVLFQIIVIPFAPGGLLYTIRKCHATEARPVLPLGPSILIMALLVVAIWTLFHYFIDFVAPTPAAAQEPARSNLAIAFTIFCMGIYSLLTRRDAIKTVIALVVMGNGIDLTLADLTPAMSETVILGVLTDVIVSIFILLYLSRMIYEKFGTSDTSKLSELRY